jgi:hypothetical protein
MQRKEDSQSKNTHMDRKQLLRLPHKDPVNGGDMFVSELTSESTGITIRGSFELPRYAKLDAEQTEFLEIFLRYRGMLNGVERELGISYPTARARLDTLLGSLGINPVDTKSSSEKHTEKRKKILEQLESGEITAAEAKQKLGVLK